MLKLKLPILWPPNVKNWLIGKDGCWERLRAGGEGDDRGWDGWMASPTLRTWVWVNSRSWWWTGRPGMLQFMELQRVRHNWATEQQQGRARGVRRKERKKILCCCYSVTKSLCQISWVFMTEILAAPKTVLFWKGWHWKHSRRGLEKQELGTGKKYRLPAGRKVKLASQIRNHARWGTFTAWPKAWRRGTTNQSTRFP